jgi:hypothetical protein
MEIVVMALVLIILLVAVDIFATHNYSKQRSLKNSAWRSRRESARGGRNHLGTYS